VGIAPLLVNREGLAGTLRVIRFLGTEAVSSDYLDFIVDAGLEQDVAAAIWESLTASASSWDWIQLTDLLDSSVVLSRVRPLALARNYECDVSIGQTCPYLVLPASRDGYWQALKIAMRNNLRRKRKHLDAAGAVFGTAETVEVMPTALEEFYRIHALRWKSKGLTGNFLDPRVRGFHGQATALLAPKGRMRLYWVRLGERTVAMIYALEFKDVLSNYQTGFDPVPPDSSVPENKYSPGMVLIGHCLEDGIDRGKSEFDFLRGPETYKFNWTRTYRHTYELTLVSPTNLRARARFWSLLAERRGKAAIKRLMGRTPGPNPWLPKNDA